MIYELEGDILLTKAQAIAHGVSPNDHFDAGLALALRELWPNMAKDFRHYAHQAHPKPGELWTSAKLVVMDETAGVLTPDRLKEMPESGNAHGFDHNYEYKVWGSYTGGKCYDPNADMELPLFAARKYELVNEKPGFLFKPSDRYNPKYIPAREAHRQTEGRR